jgi:hypothetical protein
MNQPNGRANTEEMRQAAEHYLRTGLAVIPVPAGEKRPRRDDWQNERWTVEDVPRLWTNGQNIGVLLGEPSGNLTDLDLDCDQAIQLAGRFFPPTLTTTRAGAQDSHWWFKASDRPVGQHSLQDLDGEPMLELRGGAGHHTLVPPSVHPSGEKLRWSESGLQIAEVFAAELLRCYRELGTAVLVARTLPKTGRHHCALPLAGYLLGRLDARTVEKIMLAAWDAAGYESARNKREAKRDLAGIVRDTHEKIENGEAYAGGGVLEDQLPGLRKRLSKLWGWQSQASARAKPEPEARPEIVAVARDTKYVLADCAAALVRANDPPTMFVRSGLLSMIARDEDGAAGIKPLTVDALRGRLAHAARFVRASRKGESVAMPPPKEMAQMLHAAGEWPGVPPLVGLSGVPVLRPDGTVHDAPGYDAGSRIFYDAGPSAALAHGELTPKVPRQPSRSDVQSAREGVAELLQDFPFASDTDRANAWGMLLTPIARPWIAGPVPLALIDKPKMGSGASLLAATVATVATGHAPFLGAPSSEEEWSKVITSALLAGQNVLIFDNIAERIHSAALSRALTSPTWADRLLGTNTVAHVPQRATWIATGNNIAVGGDMPRRCYRIRLDPKVSKPWQREGFAIPDLAGWALENRGRLVASLLTLCVDWHRAGRPAAGEDRPRIGGFEGWDRTISGILARAGISDFLTNLDEFYEAADEDGAEWAAFLATWHERVGSHAITLQDLVGRFGTIEGREIRAALPADLAETFEHNERGFTRRLGRALAKRNGARYGDEGYFAAEAGEHNRAKRWIVRMDSAGG